MTSAALLILSACTLPAIQQEEAVPTICEANGAWITEPAMPHEVAPEESFCDFYQFSWRAFLAQVSPSPASGQPRFLENRVYLPGGVNDQCASQPLTGVQGIAEALAPRTIKAQDFEDLQADKNALYDQNGNILLYNAFYSQSLCDSTSSGFAPGTLELKAAWMRLDEPSSSHFVIAVQEEDELVHLGLVGFHMAIFTPRHPEMIWASWEHKRNAPLCNGHSSGPKWAFASPAAAACLVKNKYAGSGPPSSECSGFAFNTPATLSDTVPMTGAPNNVCRQFAHGNQSIPALNGNDTEANLAAVTELNNALVGPEGLLTLLPADDPRAVWANYEMVGAIWTKNGRDSGASPVPNTQAPPDPFSQQRGSLELANMALETFQQGHTSAVPNCFGCHNYEFTDPLKVSHIQSHLLTTE